MAKEEGNKTVYYDKDYTRTIELKEAEHYPKVVFTFKPLNIIDVAEVTDKIMEKATVAGAAEVNVEMISRQLVKWDLKKPNGTTIDFRKIDELKRLDTVVLNKIIGIIRGDMKTPEDDYKDLQAELKNLSREQDST